MTATYRASVSLAAGVALLASGPAASQSSDILLNCTSCHSLSNTEAPRYPVLNGQPVNYLIEQLAAFRSGERTHPQMRRTAIALGAEGAPAMARMYADAPPPALAPPPEEERFADAVRLMTEGAWERGIAPCASCHLLPGADDDGIETGAHDAPWIHGQPETYLAGTLRAFASGERDTGGLRRMQAYAERLTDNEIADLSAYLAGYATTEDEQ